MTHLPGSLLTRREVMHGLVWLEQPVTVVADDGSVLAVRVDPGSPFTFHDHPSGRHPWDVHPAWRGGTVLQLVRNGDPYGIWRFFDADGRFLHWYVNLESPVVRRTTSFDVKDHGIDLVVHPDGRREWKDVEDLHRMRVDGRLDEDEVLAALAAAAEVVALLDADDRWWAPWDDWTP